MYNRCTIIKSTTASGGIDDEKFDFRNVARDHVLVLAHRGAVNENCSGFVTRTGGYNSLITSGMVVSRIDRIKSRVLVGVDSFEMERFIYITSQK